MQNIQLHADWHEEIVVRMLTLRSTEFESNHLLVKLNI
jgi:hypothetical protein